MKANQAVPMSQPSHPPKVLSDSLSARLAVANEVVRRLRELRCTSIRAYVHTDNTPTFVTVNSATAELLAAGTGKARRITDEGIFWGVYVGGIEVRWKERH